MDAIVDNAPSCISEETALRERFGAVSMLAEKKVVKTLDHFCRQFIALSPFLVLATNDASGRADASPRGDAPGFVEVLDDKTLLVPDRRGNNRLDSFSNILQNPHVGLIFMVPGINETLRINGRGRIVDEEALLGPLSVQGKQPLAGLLVTMEEAFFHCGKALIRSKLWNPESRVERGVFPTLGHVIAEQTKVVEVSEADRLVEEGYQQRLY